MHYTAGLGGLASLGGASLLAARTHINPLARLLLETSGALFALYLVLMIGLSATGRILRRRAAVRPAHVAGHVAVNTAGPEQAW
jgi:hypothetical protein